MKAENRRKFSEWLVTLPSFVWLLALFLIPTVLVFAITMMAGLLVSLVVRRHRVWIRIVSAGPGTVDVELGGLARTDNSGWGDEFEKLTERLIEDKR